LAQEAAVTRAGQIHPWPSRSRRAWYSDAAIGLGLMARLSSATASGLDQDTLTPDRAGISTTGTARRGEPEREF
jgi:hypothetical protein